MRVSNFLLAAVGSLAIFLGLSVPMLLADAKAQSTQEKFGPGRVNCAEQWCYLVGVGLLGTEALAQFDHSTLPEGKRETFAAECFNGECVATLTGTRIEPRSMMVKPSDIAWRKMP